MQTINQLDALRAALEPLRHDGPLALVPTMGALHEGHLALVRAARARAAHVVNPRQFAANEDLASYPRQPQADAALLAAEGVSVLWLPGAEAIYPPGYATTVSVSGVSDGLCGAVRPGHFDGVATVVLKLFNQVSPDIALFGEKDWQQLAVIRRMARDLDLTRPAAPAIIGVPTVREADDLARSSRNAYLTVEQRAAAPELPAAMRAALAAIVGGAKVATALESLSDRLLDAGFASIDYAELRDAETLELIDTPGTRPARLLVAARIGKARLIDNMPLG